MNQTCSCGQNTQTQNVAAKGACCCGYALEVTNTKCTVDWEVNMQHVGTTVRFCTLFLLYDQFIIHYLSCLIDHIDKV